MSNSRDKLTSEQKLVTLAGDFIDYGIGTGIRIIANACQNSFDKDVRKAIAKEGLEKEHQEAAIQRARECPMKGHGFYRAHEGNSAARDYINDLKRNQKNKCCKCKR